MAQDTETLRRDIARTRGQLGETLEEIGDRVSPKNVTERAKEGARQRLGAVGDQVNPRRLVRRGADSLRKGLRRSDDGGDGAGTRDDSAVAESVRAKLRSAREPSTAVDVGGSGFNT